MIDFNNLFKDKSVLFLENEIDSIFLNYNDKDGFIVFDSTKFNITSWKINENGTISFVVDKDVFFAKIFLEEDETYLIKIYDKNAILTTSFNVIENFEIYENLKNELNNFSKNKKNKLMKIFVYCFSFLIFNMIFIFAVSEAFKNINPIPISILISIFFIVRIKKELNTVSVLLSKKFIKQN